MDDISSALSPLFAAFASLNIVYYIGGSLASSAHGIARSTVDADVVADLHSDDVATLVASLQSQYYIDAESIMDALQRRSSFNLIHLGTMMKIDVFIPKQREFDRMALSRRVRESDSTPESEDAMDFALSFLCSPEDTVLTKLEWFELGNRVSERQWSDILGVLRVQGTALDRTYLSKWAITLGLAELLERAIAEAGI